MVERDWPRTNPLVMQLRRVDEDSIPDLIFGNVKGIGTAIGDGLGGFTFETTYGGRGDQFNDGLADVLAGDYDGDGLLDLAVADYHSLGGGTYVSVLFGRDSVVPATALQEPEGGSALMIGMETMV